MKQASHAFWSAPAAEILQELQTTPQGLSEEEAQERLTRHGSNLLKPKKRTDVLTLLLAQFKSPHYSHASLCSRDLHFSS